MDAAADFSLIVPAFNEEEELPRTLPVFLEAMKKCGRSGELIVVDNNSTDRTPQIAREHGARVVFEPENQISRARNAGAREAAGRFLVFVDADTIIGPELLVAVMDNLESGKCAGGGAGLAFDSYPRRGMHAAMRFWNWLAARRGLAAGSFVYCLREAFEAVGGFSEKVYAAEEIFFSRALRRWGKKRGLGFRVIGEHPVVSSARKGRWYSTWQLVWPSIVMVFFPFSLYSRRMCGMWYRRPAKR